MSKEMRISATIPLPEAFVERAALMAKISPAVAALEDALGVPVTVSDVTSRGPRAAKSPAAVTEPNNSLSGGTADLIPSEDPNNGPPVDSAPDHPAIETKRRR